MNMASRMLSLSCSLTLLYAVAAVNAIDNDIDDVTYSLIMIVWFYLKRFEIQLTFIRIDQLCTRNNI